MPKQIFYLLFVVFSCNSCSVKQNGRMQGAYNMLSESFKGISLDTTYTNRTQLKIYADDYMMYLRINKETGVSAMGIGTYKFDSGKLKENIFYSAAGDMEIPGSTIDSAEIKTTDKGYEQVIPQIMSYKGLLRVTEEYEAVGKQSTSPLDGAWKNTAHYAIHVNDTTKLNGTLYTIYYSGYWASGGMTVDSVERRQTQIAYGPFEMDGSNKIKQTILTATSTDLEGKVLEYDLEMNGVDKYRQTITIGGIKYVEEYERLKK